MKNNFKKFLSVFLAVVMVAGIVPFGGFVAPIEASAASSATYDKEYYTGGASFSTDVAVGARQYQIAASGRENAAKGYLTDAGFTVMGKDVNAGCSKSNKKYYYTHLGYKLGTDEKNAIRAVAFYNAGDAPSSISYTIDGHSCTFYPVTTSFVDSGTSTGSVFDLNKGVGGDTIYMYYTKDPNAGPPMTSLEYGTNATVSGQTMGVWLNGSGSADLNAGAGGDYIYISFKTTGTEVDTSALHTAITNGESYISKSSNYTSVSDLQTAVNNAKAIVNDYNADGLSASHDQTAITNAANAINSAINALKTNVYLNPNGGTLNGSTSNATVAVTIGSASSYGFATGSYVPVRTGYTFKGWAASSAATSGSTGTVNVGFMQTLYAIWQANTYTVLFDNLLDVSKWNTSGAGNGVISNFGNGGFTLTSNDGAGESTSESPLFPVTAGEKYVVDIDFEGNNWDVYIFFYDANTQSGLGIDFADGPDRRFSSSGVGNFDENGNAVFTAPAGAVRAVIRVDANGSNNAVTFKNIKVYKQGTVEDGVSYTPSQTVTYDSAYGNLPTPTKDKYDFLGWFTTDGTPVTSTTTVKTADTIYLVSQWKRSGYTVTWKNHDGTILETDEGVAAGTTPTYDGATPVKTGDAQYSYTFAGWTPTVSAIDGDTTYTATFTQVLNKYTVVWKNHDGTVLETDSNVAYGSDPVYNGTTPVKTGDAQFSYTFTGWSPAVSKVTGNVEYFAQFSESTNKYTVTWKNYDGTTLETDANVAYGTTPEYNGSEPVKAADAQYSYTFAGWEPEVDKVTGNVTYTATFTETLRTYTVTWKNEDGTVLETDSNVPYGTTPTYDSAEPTKAGDAQYSYKFSGWTPSVGEVKGDATYTAKFTQSVNKYTVTWKNSNGYVLETDDNVLYGSEPSYDGETPVKAGDAQYTYTFAGWSPELSDVTGNVTYTATFTQTVNEYTVNFVNHDGTVLQTGKVPYGTTPVYTGSEPVKTGDAQYSYAFIGWDADPVPVKGDATYTAQFEESTNVYVVTWKNYDGTVLDTNNVPYGQTPEYKGETPVKAGDAQYTYTFAGWEPEVDEVTGDAVYTAKFTATVNKYTIKFVDEDGTVLQSGKVAYGETPAYTGETPVKAADAQYTYTFDKWSPAIKAVDGDATYTATYSSVVNKYTVTWVNFDDTVLETDKDVAYGTMPAFDGSTPVKTADAQYTYAFSGWTPDVDTVKGNVTYKATFTETLRTYTVVWEDENGDAIETDYNVPYGTVPTFDGETPVKAATAQYTYTFDKWSPEVVAVTGDATYTATFTQEVNKYTVEFVDEDGTVLQSTEVAFGETPSFDGAEPSKAATAQYTYTFEGWTPAIKAVDGKATYTAVYSSVVNNYTVVWTDDDGTVLETDTDVPYGTMPTFDGATPSKVADAQYTYTFDKWSPAVSAVEGDVTYKATYTKTVNKYTVTWKNENGNILETDVEVPYGTTPEYSGSTPAKAATAQYTYTFAGWTPAVEAVTGHVTYTATFTQEVNKYTVEFVDEDGTVLQSTEVAYGETPVYAGATPSKEATAQYTYTFEGWTPEIKAVDGKATYTAVYSSVVNTYTVTWKNANGYVLETDDNVPFGTTPEYNGNTPLKEADAQYTYKFDKWSPAISAVEGNVTYTATFTATLNNYTVTWKNDNGNVLETDVEVPYGTTPDYSGAIPTKAATAQYTYTFAGWTPEISTVKGDVIYTATYEATVNEYTITWIVEGVETTQTVAYGETPDYGSTPVKAENAQYTYEFKGWTPAVESVTGDATYTAEFTPVTKSYKVTWIVDGNEWATENVLVGDAIPNKTVPQKDGFIGAWDNVPTTMPTNDVTIKAVYINDGITVTWVIDDNTTQTTVVREGNVITPDSAWESKESTVSTVYTFKGWSETKGGAVVDSFPTVVAGGANKTYYAVFEESVRTYKVVWTDEDGTVLETDNAVAYNTMPSFDGTEPSKEATAQYTYEFSGWTPAVSVVAGDATYKATYKATVNKYTVTFKNEDGTVLQSEEVAYGETPVYAGATPEKTATAQYTYTFSGWTTEIVAVTGEATYVAKFKETVNKYTVTWVDENGTVLETDTDVPYGTMPEFNHADPVKAATAQYTYTFDGWDKDIAEVTGNVTYTATYSSTVNKYTVTWTDEDGTVIETDTDVPYGETPSFDGAEPEKAATAQYTYTFAGWTPVVDTVKGNITYKATYSSVVNTYTVVWTDEDGTVLETDTDVPYGTEPTFDGTEPVKAATAQYTYAFAGWTPVVDTVKGDVTYKATYKATVNKYTVTWVDENGTVLETDAEVPYGTMPEFNGSEPSKNATAQYTYAFAGWTPEVIAVEGNATYTATYSSTVNKYTVTWADEDGTVLETDTDVPYGETPSFDGAEPSKAATAQYTFTFAGWTPVVDTVKGNITYKATYSSVVNTYTVVWTDEDGTVLETDENVPYGTVPTFDGAQPSKAATAQYTYTFAGWTPAAGAIEGNVTYKARYTQTVNKYTVTWTFADGTVRKNENVEYGSVISVPANTVKAPDAVNHYAYAWTPDVSTTVTGNADYTEQLTTTAHTWEEWTQTSAPSCDKEGTKERGCEFCEYTEQGTIATIPHTEATREENVNEPTCKDPGSYDEVVYCSVCGEVLSRETKEIPVVPHTPATAVVENNVPATCTVDGSYDEVVYCSVCGEELSRESKVHTAPGHTPAAAVVENEVPATCTVDGSYDEVVYCSVCGEELSRESKVHTAPGHTPAEAVRENEIFGSCIEGGSYDEVVYCSVCDAEISRTFVEIEVGEHKHGPVMTENIVEATCTKTGSYDEVVYCLTCGDEISRTSVTVPAKSHTPGKTVVENKVSATCSVPSSYDNVVYCTVCGEEVSRQTITGTTVPHTKGTPVKENIVEAKCTTPGSYDNVFYCIYCDAEMERVTVTTGVKGHTIVEDKAVEPTCDKNGKTLGSHCSVCGEVIVAQLVVPAPGHTVIVRQAEEPTCTNTGLTEGSYCGVCGKDLVLQEEIPALGHTDEDGDGICDLDGRDVNDMTPDDEFGVTVTPDADGDGYIDANECDDCGREHINFFSSIICFFIRIMRMLGIEVK